MNKKIFGLTAGITVVAGGSFMVGFYEGSKETIKEANTIIQKSNDDAERAADGAERSADQAERAMIGAITTRFITSAQMCINLGQATPILMRHVQTVKSDCATIDTIHNLITENKQVCDAALKTLTENEDILGKMDNKKEMVQHLERTVEEILAMEMDPEFPRACKKGTSEKNDIAL